MFLTTTEKRKRFCTHANTDESGQKRIGLLCISAFRYDVHLWQKFSTQNIVMCTKSICDFDREKHVLATLVPVFF